MTRAVPIEAEYQRRLRSLGTQMAAEGHEGASLVLSLALAWEYAPIVPEQEFRCHIDESGGLAEVYDLDPYSRKVTA